MTEQDGFSVIHRYFSERLQLLITGDCAQNPPAFPRSQALAALLNLANSLAPPGLFPLILSRGLVLGFRKREGSVLPSVYTAPSRLARMLPLIYTYGLP